MSNLKDLYNNKYKFEEWKPISLKPGAMHTNAYDDIYRLLDEAITDANILEVGCGSGRLAIALAEKGYKVTGYDLSDVRIALASKIVETKYSFLKERLEFFSGDIDDDLPFSIRAALAGVPHSITPGSPPIVGSKV